MEQIAKASNTKKYLHQFNREIDKLRENEEILRDSHWLDLCG